MRPAGYNRRYARGGTKSIDDELSAQDSFEFMDGYATASD